MTWLTYETARILEQESIIVSLAKAAGYMATCVLATVVLELAILGPLPKEDNDG